MAFRRSVTARAKLLYQQQRVVAPFPHIHRDDSDHQIHTDNTNCKQIAIPNYFQRRFHWSGNNLGNFHGSRNLFHQDRRFAIPASRWPVLVRNLSSIGELPAERSAIVSDIAKVFGDEAVGGEVANEVAIAIAAGDSSFPVAAFQYLIDYVHWYTGFNWWASIAVTAVLIRLIQLPIRINFRKINEKYELRKKELKETWQRRDMSPAAEAKAAEAQTEQLFKEFHIKLLMAPLIGGSTFCCFFLALKNMAENVPSFKEGGVLWFTDLTTPDSIYLFPVLTALSFFFTVEKANEEESTTKSSFRVLSALAIPLTATFPKAMFCYLLTSSLFSHASRTVLRDPEVAKSLGLRVKQPSADKKAASEAPEKQSASSSSSSETSLEPANQRISDLSQLNESIRSLEREFKKLNKLLSEKKSKVHS